MLGFRKLYDWMLRISASRHAEPGLAGISFCCSIFFPLPQDIMLVPMCLAKPKKAFRYAAIATIASVLGGIVAYLLGAFLYEFAARPILEIYGAENADTTFRNAYHQYGWFLVLIGGFTPLPYKVIAILSGSLGLFLPIFILASLGGRSFRFFVIAGLIYFFGESVKSLIDRYFTPLCWLLLAALLFGFYMLAFVL